MIANQFAWLGLVLCAISTALGGDRPRVAAVKLNLAALDYAQELIKQGRIIADRKGSWGRDQPSAENENEFIRIHGFGEYAKWHLGVDERHAENTKSRYKFPYGDLKNMHRCALLAVRSRARQYGHSEIETAATKLLNEMMSSKMSSEQVNSTVHPTR